MLTLFTVLACSVSTLDFCWLESWFTSFTNARGTKPGCRLTQFSDLIKNTCNLSENGLGIL